MSDAWIRKIGICFGLLSLAALPSCSGDNGGSDGGGNASVTESPVPYGVWRFREQVFACDTDSLIYTDEDEGLRGVLLCENAWHRFHDPSSSPMAQTARGLYHYTYTDTLQAGECTLSVLCDATMEVYSVHRFVEETVITVSADDPAGCAGAVDCLRSRVIYIWWREATDQECAEGKVAGDPTSKVLPVFRRGAVRGIGP